MEALDANGNPIPQHSPRAQFVVKGHKFATFASAVDFALATYAVLPAVFVTEPDEDDEGRSMVGEYRHDVNYGYGWTPSADDRGAF